MSEKIDKHNESDTQKISNRIGKSQGIDNSIVEFSDTRPISVAQRKLQETADRSIQLKQITRHQQAANQKSSLIKTAQLQQDNSSHRNVPIQLQNKLTMHHKGMPKEKQRAGGGKDSNINTGKEVDKVLASGVKEDVKDSKEALNQSIEIREEEQSRLGGDEGHAQRIIQEKTWMQKLQKWIQDKFPKKDKKKSKEVTDDDDFYGTGGVS